MNRLNGYGGRVLAISMGALSVLLWPITRLEVKTGADKIAQQKFGPIPLGHQALAHVERWGILGIGVMSALYSWMHPMLYWTPLMFLTAAVLDPFYWSWKFKTPMVAREDFVLGLVVNLAPIWMFLIGYSIGAVIP